MNRLLILILMLSTVHSVQGQVVQSIVLDSAVVIAVNRGFNVNDFIEMVKSDTSFRRGFSNLHNSPHFVSGDMTIYNKKKHVVATRFRRAQQHVVNGKRWIEITNEKADKGFYNRKKEPKTYTAELFDELFFYTDTLTAIPLNTPMQITPEKKSSNTAKLKTLVFQPGAPVEGVPVFGKRMAIFEEEMAPYYDYSISVSEFGNSTSCYVFSCITKPYAGDYPVLRSLKTWFDRSTFQIVYREYSYRYYGVLFDLDVIMKVTMGYSGGMLFPKKIEYSGFWDLPMRKEERADFSLDFELVPSGDH